MTAWLLKQQFQLNAKIDPCLDYFFYLSQSVKQMKTRLHVIMIPILTTTYLRSLTASSKKCLEYPYFSEGQISKITYQDETNIFIWCFES